MKKILILNPVNNDLVNDRVNNYLQGIKDSNYEVKTASINEGPPSIQRYYDVVEASPAIIKLAKSLEPDYQAMVVNCFADPGLRALREILNIPIAGAGESSLLLALSLGASIGVISVDGDGDPWVELQVREMGIDTRLAGIKGIDMPVLDLESGPQFTAENVIKAATKLIEKDGAEVIVLGCTGLAGIHGLVKDELGVPIIEPLAAAYRTAQSLAALNLTHSKKGLYKE